MSLCVGRVAAAAAANMAQLGGRETDYEQLRETRQDTAPISRPLLSYLRVSSSSSFPSLLPLPFGTYLRSRRARPFLPFPPSSILFCISLEETMHRPYRTVLYTDRTVQVETV